MGRKHLELKFWNTDLHKSFDFFLVQMANHFCIYSIILVCNKKSKPAKSCLRAFCQVKPFLNKQLSVWRARFTVKFWQEAWCALNKKIQNIVLGQSKVIATDIAVRQRIWKCLKSTSRLEEKFHAWTYFPIHSIRKKKSPKTFLLLQSRDNSTETSDNSNRC